MPGFIRLAENRSTWNVSSHIRAGNRFVKASWKGDYPKKIRIRACATLKIHASRLLE
jgi:hypothetical protein